MFVRRLLVRKQLTILSCSLKQTRCTSQVAVEPEFTGGTSNLRLSPERPKKPTRKPFAKNIFMGEFDVEFLTYPEPQTLDRHREFFEWLKPIEDYINESVNAQDIDRTSTINDEVFEELKKLGVMRAAVDEAHGGLGLNTSEYAKLVETLSAVPILGLYFTKRAKIVNLIRKYATEEQKSDLLPKIADGEITPALCFSENPTGSMSDPLEGKSVLSDCLTFYTINAHKTGVFDANRANLFIVLALDSSSDTYVKAESMMGYLVPLDAKGVKIMPRRDMAGQRGVDICDVIFDNVEIPTKNVLGKETIESELFINAYGDGKQNVGAQSVGLLKRFLNLLVTQVRESKNFNTKRQIEDSQHEIISKVAVTVYALEAMTYITTGMIDEFENQDTTIETSLVELYSSNACVKSIMDGMAMLGLVGFQEDQPFERLLRDALTLGIHDRSSVDSRIFAALLGLKHVGVFVGDKVKQYRNPLFHPYEMIKLAMTFSGTPKLYLDENLHPSLRASAQSLEASVNKLKKCVHELFLKHGIALLSHRMELRRLTDMIVEIYVMTAVVARASRSYCIGMRNAEEEIRVAMWFTYHTHEKVCLIAKELEEGDWVNGDIVLKEVGEAIFQRKQYFATHPLERNF